LIIKYSSHMCKFVVVGRINNSLTLAHGCDFHAIYTELPDNTDVMYLMHCFKV